MKKSILLLSIILFSFFANSQVRLGFTISEIMTEMPYKHFKKKIVDDVPYISYREDDMEWVYYFNENGLCYLTALIPLRPNLVPEIIEQYNKTKVIVSDTHWKNYTNGTVINTYLVYDKKSKIYFFTFNQ